VVQAHRRLIFMGATVRSAPRRPMIGTIAVAVNAEIVLAVIAGLFVLEAVSVSCRWRSFQAHAKRSFPDGPIHASFRATGLDRAANRDSGSGSSGDAGPGRLSTLKLR